MQPRCQTSLAQRLLPPVKRWVSRLVALPWLSHSLSQPLGLRTVRCPRQKLHQYVHHCGTAIWWRITTCRSPLAKWDWFGLSVTALARAHTLGQMYHLTQRTHSQWSVHYDSSTPHAPLQHTCTQAWRRSAHCKLTSHLAWVAGICGRHRLGNRRRALASTPGGRARAK